MKLVTDTELADAFAVTVEELHRLRKRHHWPHVKLGRNEYRFTEGQIEEIVTSRMVKGAAPQPTTDTGLTEQSARRSA